MEVVFLLVWVLAVEPLSEEGGGGAVEPPSEEGGGGAVEPPPEEGGGAVEPPPEEGGGAVEPPPEEGGGAVEPPPEEGGGAVEPPPEEGGGAEELVWLPGDVRASFQQLLQSYMYIHVHYIKWTHRQTQSNGTDSQHSSALSLS